MKTIIEEMSLHLTHTRPQYGNTPWRNAQTLHEYIERIHVARNPDADDPEALNKIRDMLWFEGAENVEKHVRAPAHEARFAGRTTRERSQSASCRHICAVTLLCDLSVLSVILL